LKSLWLTSCHANKGTAAVEFALVAGPLIVMIFACLELALIILLSVTLDNATDIASRQIRTGITTQANSDVNSFKQSICDNMGWLGATCMSDLMVDVQTYNSFGAVPNTDLIKDGEFETANFAYKIGAGNSIQLVRAYYQWHLFTPFLESGLKLLDNGDAVIATKVVFRNEPF
jgi:Flp pilus assembly protein TadG